MSPSRFAALAVVPLLLLFGGCSGTAEPAGDQDAVVAVEQPEAADKTASVDQKTPAPSFSVRESLKRMIVDEATTHGRVPPALALALARAASGFAEHALGVTGAAGVMQLFPEITKAIESDASTPSVVAHVRAALDHLATLHERYGGDWALALSDFRGGPLPAADGDDAWRPHEFTRDFVDEVLYWERQYRRDPVVAAWIREASGLPRFAADGSPAFDRGVLPKRGYARASADRTWPGVRYFAPVDCESAAAGVGGGRWIAVTGRRFR